MFSWYSDKPFVFVFSDARFCFLAIIFFSCIQENVLMQGKKNGYVIKKIFSWHQKSRIFVRGFRQIQHSATVEKYF